MKTYCAKLSEKSLVHGLYRTMFVITFCLILGVPQTSHSGAYIFSGEINGVDVITHSTGYSGTGGILNVNICIDPSSPNAFAMEIPVENIVNTFNARVGTTPNLVSGVSNNIPSGEIDFESVALHEVGHCLGLDHVNASSESGLGEPDRNYTKATNGADNIFNLTIGADSVRGSGDDGRGDDVNLHWYEKNVNNPFTKNVTVDSTTYARSLADLPGGDSFAANGDRAVANLLLGAATTESIMQQGTFTDEAQRSLIADDVATLEYAMSGLDEVSGNGDDYTLNLVYQGVSSTNCDINLKFDDVETAFAVCKISGLTNGDHFSVNVANSFFHNGFSWFFNDTPNVVDTEPSAFIFSDQTNTALNAVITSAPITVLGINTPSTVTAGGDEYNINGGIYTTVAGMVNHRDTVTVRHTSAGTLSTATNTVLTINGNVSDTFTSTTAGVDTTPDAFSFTDQSGILRSTLVTSDTVTITGITVSAAVDAGGDEYSINGGAFVTAAGTVNNNDTVVVRHTSAAGYFTAINTTLTVGGVTDVFSSTTVQGDNIPDAFVFTDVSDVAVSSTITSNTITIAGIVVPASITITGGEYSVNGAAFTSASGMVSNGDTVVVRHTSSASNATVTTTGVSIGGVSESFISTTIAGSGSGGGGGGVINLLFMLLVFCSYLFKSNRNKLA